MRAVGEQVPLADGIFDLAISEHGAAIRPIPTAGSLRRPNSPAPEAS